MDTTQPTPDTGGQADTTTGQSARTPADLLRYVPPVSALGTAFVLQTIAITDMVGSTLAGRYHTGWMYALAGLLGVSVASCLEGGAAYLMDLYDRHLLVGDSVWLLRLTMVVYVVASGAVIHWWLHVRGLPDVISWLLAGMSASALYLWSRGSRWRRRKAMRDQGLIDPAMPRLPVAARMLHPVRYLITLYLISWEPVRTPDEARARYEQWRTARRWFRPAVTVQATVQAADTRPKVERTPVRTPAVDTRPAAKPDTARTGRAPLTATLRPDSRPAVDRTVVALPSALSVDELAATLAREHPGQVIGKPKALDTLRRVHGSCSADRAIAAKNLHNERVAAGDDPAPLDRDLTVSA